MLAAIGMFVFETNSALFDRLRRSRDWRHDRSDRFGARPASQFLGPGEDRISITGTLVPELVGDYFAIETLARMADEGEAWPLADGLGNVIGTYTIERIDEEKDNFTEEGIARRNAFSIELARVD